MLHIDHLLHVFVDIGVFGLLALFCMPLRNHPVSGKCRALETCQKPAFFSGNNVCFQRSNPSPGSKQTLKSKDTRFAPVLSSAPHVFFTSSVRGSPKAAECSTHGHRAWRGGSPLWNCILVLTIAPRHLLPCTGVRLLRRELLSKRSEEFENSSSPGVGTR